MYVFDDDIVLNSIYIPLYFILQWAVMIFCSFIAFFVLFCFVLLSLELPYIILHNA